MTYGAHIWTLNITALAWKNWKWRFNLWYHSSWSWTNSQSWAITVFLFCDKYASSGRPTSRTETASWAPMKHFLSSLLHPLATKAGGQCYSGDQQLVLGWGVYGGFQVRVQLGCGLEVLLRQSVTAAAPVSTSPSISWAFLCHPCPVLFP